MFQIFLLTSLNDLTENRISVIVAAAAAAAAKSLQSCLTLCNPRDGSPPYSPVPGILQARTLEWVAISFSNAWKWKVKAKLFCRVRLLATPWTAAHQAPPSMGFSRQKYWSGCHCLLRRLIWDVLKSYHLESPQYMLNKWMNYFIFIIENLVFINIYPQSASGLGS